MNWRKNAQKIGQINITPDLLQSLLKPDGAMEERTAGEQDARELTVRKRFRPKDRRRHAHGSRLEELTRKFNTRSQATFYMARARENFVATRWRRRVMEKRGVADRNASFNAIEEEHTVYTGIPGATPRRSRFWHHRHGDRPFPTWPTSSSARMTSSSPSARTASLPTPAKYALGLPIVAVNPDPARIDGILLPFRGEQARVAVRNTLDGKSKSREVTLAEATLNDGQKLLAFNDLFIGQQSHVSARYRLECNSKSEAQSSSGILISTGAGSTGWLSSVFNMASAVTSKLAGSARGTARQAALKMTWEDQRLVFVVREPFISKASQAELTAGILDGGEELIVESQNGHHQRHL